MKEKLALLGGKPAIEPEKVPFDHLFRWPIIGKEDEEAALYVMSNNLYSGTGITAQFEQEVCQWLGTKYAIAYCNGTMSIAAALYGVGLQAGDEIICPTRTYWATITHAFVRGATPVFCNITENLVIDPDDIERCITDRTKAIIVVHYFGYPCDMDKIMAIAKKHNLKVIEDVSHAQGGLSKGKRLGTFGDVAAMSMMSTKSFSAGELGMLVTDDRTVYERAMAYCHYERYNDQYIQECDDLKPFYHICLGGYKGRANQLCVALAREQLKHYDERCAEVRKAMNYFWDLLEGVPGIRPIRVDESTGSNMAGWYSPHGQYHPEELHGLPVEKFCEALTAEGFKSRPDGNACLHKHEMFHSLDLLGLGKPSRNAFSDRDYTPFDEGCKPSEKIHSFLVRRFVHFDKEWIEYYANAVKKVVENHMDLLDDKPVAEEAGRWYNNGTE